MTEKHWKAMRLWTIEVETLLMDMLSSADNYSGERARQMGRVIDVGRELQSLVEDGDPQEGG